MLKEDTNTTSAMELPDPTKLPGHSPREQLNFVLSRMQNWDKLSESNRCVALNFFMKCIGHLYLDYFQHHLDEAKQIGAEYAETLNKLMEPIEKEYILPKWGRFRSMGDYSDLIWPKMCEFRTNIEAFQDMFSTICRPFNERLMEWINDFIEGHKTDSMMLKKSEIPKNAPESHWWWFYKTEYTIEKWEAEERFLNQNFEDE